jgi:hypothetical protein
VVGKNVNNMKILVSKEDKEYIFESIKSGEVLAEDLRRWFKEKWVDVSKKVDGKHPPCGRKDADGKSYPKCRPSKKVSKETPKVASSYSKKEKKSMTSQKRRAEKKDPKVGKGNKPTMTRFNEENRKKMNITITEQQFKRLFENNEETPVLIYEDEFGSVENTDFVCDNLLNEAEYQGRKVQLNKPFLTPDGPKKRSVYVKNSKGNVVKVNFGDPNMRIKKNIPSHRKSFRARHHCETATDKTTPRYWSCKFW